jgi:nucleoid DNA-binding protein
MNARIDRMCATIIKRDIAEAAYRAADRATRGQVAEVGDAMLDEIAAALSRDEDVRLTNFGTFVARHRKPKPRARNIWTGERMVAPGRRAVFFRASSAMRAKVGSAE